MLEQCLLDGRPCTVAYLKGDMEPASKDDYTYVKLLFEDGHVVFASRQFDRTDVLKDRLSKLRAKLKSILKYDPNQPRDEHGRWTKEG